ncbi:AGAMOUS-like 69, MADS AFFECTING FLOWERING 4 [Hibiscus trionum]|uniref:AGAMOUS-like 69, MADS AFFECTING FLOWERING 4 n=1 Tax=Hibiscus trionum TaxID=183268 RepID=A0A9W7I332_HIBTR|nr:AGAMOUS-like 69, MADS AFFECTING FLOWERING 4 [Hibiscus trionum]
MTNAINIFASLVKILGRYSSHCEQEPEASKYHNEAVLSYAEVLHIVQSQLEESTIEQLSLRGLEELEIQLAETLSGTRARKAQLVLETILTRKEKEKLLKAENELLEREIAAMEKNEEYRSEMAMELKSKTENQGHLPQRQTLMLLPP